MSQENDTVDGEEETFGLSARVFDEVLDAVEANDARTLDELLGQMHPADVADLLEQLDGRDRKALLSLWKGGMDGEILSELNESLREEVIQSLAPQELAEAVRELESDDVVDLVEYLDEAQQEAVLGALHAADRVAVEKALAYPEESAGRLMQVEVVRAPEHWTVGQAIDFMRSNKALPDQFYHVVLVDPRMKPIGHVMLGRLLAAAREVRLRDLMEESFRTFHVEDDEGAVAYAFNQYHLISAPVVDDDDRLVGVITIDDAMIVLDEEHEDDYLKLAGVGVATGLNERVIATARGRFPWLLVYLVAANLAASVIAQFEATIERIVLLAILMPIVASMGGNAGTQTLAVAVRALATRDLTTSNAWRVVRREALVGALNGFGFAVIMGLVVLFWFGEPMIGLVIGVALFLTLIGAAVGGIAIPLGLEKLGIDPAIASGPFVTTITDIIGFFVFLGIATLVLV